MQDTQLKRPTIQTEPTRHSRRQPDRWPSREPLSMLLTLGQLARAPLLTLVCPPYTYKKTIMIMECRDQLTTRTGQSRDITLDLVETIVVGGGGP